MPEPWWSLEDDENRRSRSPFNWKPTTIYEELELSALHDRRFGPFRERTCHQLEAAVLPFADSA